MPIPKEWGFIPEDVRQTFFLDDFVTQYGTGQNPIRVPAEIRRLFACMRENEGLVGKDILDIGGGSSETTDAVYCYGDEGSESDAFEPWYSRVAHVAGGHVTCVDIGDNSSEKFTSKQCDLRTPNILIETYGRQVFDLINNYKFTLPPGSKHWKVEGNSPHLRHQIVNDFMHMPPSWKLLLKSLGDRNWYLREFSSKITQQVETMLKEGGLYTHAEFVFQKQHGKLKHVGAIGGLGS